MSYLKPISDSVAKLTKESFSRKFVSLSRILTQWEDIIGKDMAGKCQPIKLNYRKPKSKNDKPQATLDIAASSADAAVLVFQKTLILERINQLFGDNWVTDIKFDHLAARDTKKASERKVKPLLTPEDMQNLSATLGSIEDEELKKRLERLGQGVLRKRNT